MLRRRNPDDEDLLRRLVVETDDDPRAMRGKKGHYVEFRVYDGTMLVATANFLLNRAYADAVEIQVAARYRRRGVASWIYRWVERKTGMRIRHSKDQTTDGKAFARGRRRNPGDAKSIEDQMVKAYGVSPYADVMRAWILADGRILDLDRRDAEGVVVANLEHDLMLPTYFERAGHPRYGYDQAMTVFMDLTGSIRLADGGGGAMFHLAKVPTPAQVTACGRIAAAHAAMDQDSIEIYYQPADRLLEVRPISAGKVRRILEALPGLPPATAPRAKPRRNPPKDVETLKALGDECSVWAIAAATGRSVPEVRKAFLAVGADIWRKGGQGSGASMRQIRAVIRHLDFDHRIVAVGTSGMLGGGPRAQFAAMQSALFVRGRQRSQIGADEFDVPEGLKDDVVRTMGPEAAVREVDGHVTVGSLIDQARSSGLSLLAVTMNARRYRGAYVVRAHVVGYSKAHGLYDTSVPTRAARAAFVQGKPDEDMTGIEWFGHGEDIPQRTRLAVLWVFFKPA